MSDGTQAIIRELGSYVAIAMNQQDAVKMIKYISKSMGRFVRNAMRS